MQGWEGIRVGNHKDRRAQGRKGRRVLGHEGCEGARVEGV